MMLKITDYPVLRKFGYNYKINQFAYAGWSFLKLCVFGSWKENTVDRELALHAGDLSFYPQYPIWFPKPQQCDP